MTHAHDNPLHPGAVVLRQCIKPLGLSITDAAALGVTRNTLSELVNGKRGVSPEMAMRLEKAFDGGAESWLVQQAQYDLVHVQRDRISGHLKDQGLSGASIFRQRMDSTIRAARSSILCLRKHVPGDLRRWPDKLEAFAIRTATDAL